jgi:hypothetical protein
MSVYFFWIHILLYGVILILMIVGHLRAGTQVCDVPTEAMRFDLCAQTDIAAQVERIGCFNVSETKRDCRYDFIAMDKYFMLNECDTHSTERTLTNTIQRIKSDFGVSECDVEHRQSLAY